MLETALLGAIFDLDNWAKWPSVCDLNYPAVTVVEDVVYNPEKAKVCKADLLYNKDSVKFKKYPVIMNIHGGGWIIGDKTNSLGQCLQMADGGAFVVNINYGMPPKRHPFFEKNDPKDSHSKDYLWPTQLHDAYKALEWIKDNAEKYNLDLDNIIVSGDSAGSHLASCVATATSNPEYAKVLGLPETPPVKLKGAILFCGLYDLEKFGDFDMKKVPIARCMLEELVGNSDPTLVEGYKTTSPLPYITKDMPRTLVVSGDFDVFTYGQSDLIEKRIREVGGDVLRYKGKGPLSLHDFHLLTFTEGSHDCMKYVSRFVDETVAK